MSELNLVYLYDPLDFKLNPPKSNATNNQSAWISELQKFSVFSLPDGSKLQLGSDPDAGLGVTWKKDKFKLSLGIDCHLEGLTEKIFDPNYDGKVSMELDRVNLRFKYVL